MPFRLKFEVDDELIEMIRLELQNPSNFNDSHIQLRSIRLVDGLKISSNLHPLL
jgi:hypothetical protein